MHSLQLELDSLINSSFGVIISGDVNVHNLRWLRHSTHNSAESRELEKFSLNNRSKGLVQGPPREGIFWTLCSRMLIRLPKSPFSQALLVTIAY